MKLLRVRNDMGVSEKRPNFHFGVEYPFKSSRHLLNWDCKQVCFLLWCDMILTVCRQWTKHLVFVCLVQRSTWGLSLIKWSSLHTSPSTPKHSGAVVLMFFWSTNTHFRNRCHRQQDSRLSIHTASGFIDSEGERVCSYKQHTGVLLKHTLQTLQT